MDRFLQLFGHFVQFSYACWDRIVLRGYYPRLQRPENIVHFFRDVCGDARITPTVLARRTATHRRWLDSFTEQQRIPILTAPKGVRKEEVVAPYYRSFKADAGVVVILKSMEQSSTFISYEPRHTPPSGDDYRLIKRASKRFLHYYFYVLDPIMGPMSLCVASYLPFSVNCFMNGHSFLAGELRRAGVAFRMEDNAIIRCADPDLLNTIAERLDERILQQRASYWASRLAPPFSARERARCQLRYQVVSGPDRIRPRRDLPAPCAAACSVPACGRDRRRARRLDPDPAYLRTPHQPPLSRQARDGSGAARRRLSGAALLLQELLRQTVREGQSAAAYRDLPERHLTYHLKVGRKLANLPVLKQRLAATTDRYSTISATRWGSLPPDLGDDLAPFNYHASNQIRPKFAQNPQFRRIRQLTNPHTLKEAIWQAPRQAPSRLLWTGRLASTALFVFPLLRFFRGGTNSDLRDVRRFQPCLRPMLRLTAIKVPGDSSGNDLVAQLEVVLVGRSVAGCAAVAGLRSGAGRV